MNPAQLGAWFRANRTAALAVGGAGVVGLGVLARKKAGGDTTASSGTDYPPGFSGGAQVAGVTGTYDSSASDLYSALSPELAGIAQRLEELRGETKPPTPVPAAPKPTTPAPPKAAPKPTSPAGGYAAGFYKMAGTSNLYRIAGGKIDYLTRPEFNAMTKGQKNVKVTAISRDSAVFGNGSHWLDKHKQKPAAAAPVKK